MIKKTLFITALCSSITLAAQDVTPYTPGVTAEGIVYYLPNTELEIKVTTTQSTYTPGELVDYANRYLRKQNVSDTPEQHWEIKSIEVTPKGVPNPKTVFAIKLKDKSAASLVELTKDGIIKAINTTSPEEKIQITPSQEKKQLPDPNDFLTEEILMAGSSAKKAELIAKEIYNIRESKNSLTRGQADYMPEDGAALKLMLEKLNEQEQALTEMFTGSTEQEEKTFTYYVNPEAEMNNEVLIRFNKKYGIVKRNDLLGEPIYISINYQNNLPKTQEEGKKKKQENGVIYNIPGKAKVTIKYGTKNLYESEIPFAQFGNTEVLVNDLFNKKNNTRVIFDITTGGILKIDKD